MANIDLNPGAAFPSIIQLRQDCLFSLISELCPNHQQLAATDKQHFIVDSRLEWSFESIDGHSSWMYLERACRFRLHAGCLVLSAD